MLLFILESHRTFEVSKDERKINRVNEGRDEFNYEKTFVDQPASSLGSFVNFGRFCVSDSRRTKYHFIFTRLT